MHVVEKWLALIGCLSVMILFGCEKNEQPKPTNEIAKPTAAADRSTQPKKQPDESIVAKLAKLGVKAKLQSEDELLITEGFPYQKDLKREDVIEIASIDKGGIFTASDESLVPQEMRGMVYLVHGLSFFAKCNAKEGTGNLADAVGNKWIFKQSGMEFNVYLPGSTNPVFNVRSKANGATINFTEDGVVLKRFIVKPIGDT